MGRLRAEDGSAAFPTLVGVMILLVGFGVMTYMARVPNVVGELQLAAAAGARAGSQQAWEADAHSVASSVAREQLAERNVPCHSLRETISPSMSGGQLARGSTVSVELSCTIYVGDITWVNLPIATTVGASFSAPVDMWRGELDE